MDKIDQCLHLMDDIASCFKKAFNFRFFCKNSHDFGGCKDQNGDVKLFVEKLIKNIKSNRLVQQKKKFLFVIALK